MFWVTLSLSNLTVDYSCGTLKSSILKMYAALNRFGRVRHPEFYNLDLTDLRRILHLDCHNEEMKCYR